MRLIFQMGEEKDIQSISIRTLYADEETEHIYSQSIC